MTRSTQRAILMAIFATSGVMHFVAPGPFLRIVPPALPRPDLLVAVSGAAEIAGAIGLAIPTTRRAAGWSLIALLVAVFPANIQMLIDTQQPDASAWWKAALWLRLPAQPALIWLVAKASLGQSED